MYAVASGGLVRPDREHLSLCVGVQQRWEGLCLCTPSQGHRRLLWDAIPGRQCPTSSSGGIMSLRVCVRFGFCCALALGCVARATRPACVSSGCLCGTLAGMCSHAECGQLPCTRVRNCPGTALLPRGAWAGSRQRGPQHPSLQRLPLAARSQ